MQDGFLFSGPGKELAPGVDDTGIACKLEGFFKGTGAVCCGYENLVFDCACACECLPMHEAFDWPGGRQEEDGNVFEGQSAHEFREADVIAEQRRAFDAVNRVGHDGIASSKVFFFAMRGEQMGFMIGRRQMAAAVKDVAGIEYMLPDAVGDGAADDIDLVFGGEAAEDFAHQGTIRVGVSGDRARIKADIPELRQQNGIRTLLHGLCKQALHGVKVCFKVSELDIHLQNR